ncbi:FxsA family protein [Solibacillus daqui]|uniref:FxsA family protein n=1 Tax=Solibacillus daqui TaxID=2912187 RepID=UPI0023656BD3|nr:FxsA family protein [Solibacillus daqui]
MKKLLWGMLALGFAEIAMLILIGKAIGVFYTLLLIVLTSVVGVLIAKQRGMKSYKDVQNSLQQGQPPGIAMIETFMIFIGGVLMVFPGFITDIIGLLFVLGITRNLFKPLIFYYLRKKMKRGNVIIVQR